MPKKQTELTEVINISDTPSQVINVATALHDVIGILLAPGRSGPERLKKVQTELSTQFDIYK